MRALLTLLLFASALSSQAAVFTVTSNADSGPGTLRDEILQANASPLTAPNTIVFNITDQSQAGRTITLLSTLPSLSSFLTIDGTTQPGAAFGISDARVVLTNLSNWNLAIFFDMYNVTNIQIYGLWLQGAYVAGVAFHFRQCKNLQFGAPGKGNLINGFNIAFNCNQLTYTESTSSNITIQSNIMGTDPTGMTTVIGSLNYVSFAFVNVANLQIGGLNPKEGNLIVETTTPMDYSCTRLEDFGYMNIEGNLHGTDITGNKRLSIQYSDFQISGYNDGNGKLGGTTPLIVNIINNVSNSGFSLFDIASPFTIQGNHLGVGIDNVTNLIAGSIDEGTTVLLAFEFCTAGLVGGSNPGQKNYVAYDQYGVVEFHSGDITISQNSFFCNDRTGISIEWDYPTRPAPFITINLLTTGLVGGAALPNSIVELFYDDECPGCEGKTYIGTTTADNTGNWSYPLAATGAIVATATDPFGSTTQFSQATINTDKLVIKNASCGKKNGSIKNIAVSSGTEWFWKDAQGNIVATSTDLTNVGPGTYTFSTSIGGASCDASSVPYSITNDALPAFDPNDISITQPNCGGNNGALGYSGVFDPTAVYNWQLGGNTVLIDFSTQNPYTKLTPGAYTLLLSLSSDPTCTASYGPFTLVNQTGPTLSTAAVAITTSTCGQNNGSLAGITYQNAMQPVYIAWRDEAGNTVGTNIDLTAAHAGKYRLVFKDAGSCDTIYSSWYTIPDLGTITVDVSKEIATPASCDGANGSITGIQSTNATSFTWRSLNNGAGTVGNMVDLAAIAAGNYQLTLTNGIGCQAQTPPISVPQVAKPQIDYSGMQSLNDTCNAGLASIMGLAAMDKEQTYTWAWYKLDANGNNADPAIGSTAGSINNIGQGTYEVELTDQYGCKVTSRTFLIDNSESNLARPQVTNQYIPRNTSTVIKVGNRQTGTYKLLDSDMPNAGILDSSPTGILQTPNIVQDETLYVLLALGDCNSLAPVAIKVFDSVRVFVPNAFSPNNDGINDRWHVVVLGLVQKIHIAVYDRWGELVFSSNDPSTGWDGSFHGQVITGSFVYLVDGIDFFNKPFHLKGTLVVIQ